MPDLICQWCDQQLVEVDNPMRREIRHRRGLENRCPGPPKPGDRVYVTDPALAKLREIMRDATGREPTPNHHGTVEDNSGGRVLIVFDDGGSAPYPLDEVRRLTHG